MPSIIKNPIIKVIAVCAGLVFVLFVIFAAINLATTSTGLSGQSLEMMPAMNDMATESRMAYSVAPSSAGYQPDYIPPAPTPTGYVPNLEEFETTIYNLDGRVKQFESACNTLANLKADNRYHFKVLTSGLNNCRATFYTEESYAGEALNQLTQFSGVTTNRNTQSVTRHREQIQTQSSIIREQLQSVEQTLAEAQVAYDEIATFARAERDVAEYGNAIEMKLRQIDQLTSRKISLTSQLNNLAQQATDLEERIGVIEVSVNYNRSYTLNPDRTARDWERAWQALNETWTTFGTGLTAYFGVFILYTVQYSLYFLVLIVFARFGWKLVRTIWKL